MPLVRLDPRIRRVVPVAFRRWRAEMSPGRDVARVRRVPPRAARETYTAILDLQEQVKGAIVSRIARGDAPRPRPAQHPRAARDAASTTSTTGSRATCTSSTGARARGRGAGLHGVGSAALAVRAAGDDGGDARGALRARVPRDEPRRQAVARGSLARARRPVRERRHRDAAAVGQRRGAGAQRAPRRGRRDGDRAAAPDAGRARDARAPRGGGRRRRHRTHAPRGRARHADRRRVHDDRCRAGGRRADGLARDRRRRQRHRARRSTTSPAALGHVLRDAPRC